MRASICVLFGFLALLVAPPAGAANGPAPVAAKPTTVELVEDLRVLSLVHALHPTPDQLPRLAAVAQTGKEALEKLDEELNARLDKERERLLAAREKLLRGGTVPTGTDAGLATATATIQATRGARLETLIQTLTARVQRILTREQAEIIEAELAPSFDQPWRRYARLLAGPNNSTQNGRARLPADPGKWLSELRDLRTDAAEGDPAQEVEDFGRKMSRGLTPGTPLFDQTVAQAKGFATQVLALPPAVFAQREAELARMVAKQELSTRNQQRTAEGKPLEQFDPYRWWVEEVMLSPRAAPDLTERANAH